jgi:hypothetical protein
MVHLEVLPGVGHRLVAKVAPHPALRLGVVKRTV